MSLKQAPEYEAHVVCIAQHAAVAARCHLHPCKVFHAVPVALTLSTTLSQPDSKLDARCTFASSKLECVCVLMSWCQLWSHGASLQCPCLLPPVAAVTAHAAALLATIASQLMHHMAHVHTSHDQPAPRRALAVVLAFRLLPEAPATRDSAANSNSVT
jgi:hypothetical protein